MELTAVIRALGDARAQPCTVEVYTDSQYVQKGISEWLPDWKRRGWRTADKQPVKNVDLWQELERAAGQHRVTWHWVKGHAGHPENERADALANRGVEELVVLSSTACETATWSASSLRRATSSGPRSPRAAPAGCAATAISLRLAWRCASSTSRYGE